MLNRELVQKRLEDAQSSLRTLRKREDEMCHIRTEVMIRYCNETIMLCNVLLALMKKAAERKQSKKKDSGNKQEQ
jgi:hypothetical protein